MFGGIGEGLKLLRDTWRWSGSQWIRETPRRSPPARAPGDGTTLGRHVAIFAGSTRSGPIEDQRTWILTGRTWKPFLPDPSPTPGSYPAIEWDPVREHAVFLSSSTWVLEPGRSHRPQAAPLRQEQPGIGVKAVGDAAGY